MKKESCLIGKPGFFIFTIIRFCYSNTTSLLAPQQASFPAQETTILMPA
jgi:hypothetical protein